ncbi:AraC-like DNA-binding protein [Paenibacillus cellulosilyticus]|uniref:AraC-like DNA-binding protein n=1 Tax=Paenibacillus cellulosilyticus TaxID=375489 RepID=A0A2V2YUB4_9BACL|nr:AraC family transcriptional regulator [Paenibacillus cellulosilyticus]PWW03217.1 AraC-like DNA-binding protein [Paenibacillus cellulosilyticus]QKS43706.1 helix-turn-helix transcriptional regulator [Paenibacillus cellulosilyticus]
MDVLLVISHMLKEDEYRRVQRMFTNMVIMPQHDFTAVVEHIRSNKYKFIVLLSFEDTLPQSWKVDDLKLDNPIMILLKVSKLDLFLFYSFLDSVGLLSKPAAAGSDNSQPPPLLYKSIEYIEENICENDLCLETVAANIFVSRCHYSRMFKEHFGIGFKEYIMNKRVQKAKVMLQEGVPVTDVCYAVGYGDLTHFGRVFKRLVGEKPSDYRKKNARMVPNMA